MSLARSLRANQLASILDEAVRSRKLPRCGDVPWKLTNIVIVLRKKRK